MKTKAKEEKTVERTSMQLSLTIEDKIWLQRKAAEEQTTVAALVRKWVAREKKREEDRGKREATRRSEQMSKNEKSDGKGEDE